jgi:hypothetical protein
MDSRTSLSYTEMQILDRALWLLLLWTNRHRELQTGPCGYFLKALLYDTKRTAHITISIV